MLIVTLLIWPGAKAIVDGDAAPLHPAGQEPSTWNVLAAHVALSRFATVNA
jgi:hypothetical protein